MSCDMYVRRKFNNVLQTLSFLQHLRLQTNLQFALDPYVD